MHDPSSPTRSGFHGTIGSLPLADLLQVWSMNRFSGVVTVSAGDGTGHVYFVDGEIVHAEAAGLVGEPAVPVILGWPEGAFELFPNTATLHRTIQKGFSHLMLDAHREIDERRRATAPGTVSRPPPAAPREPARSGVLEQVRGIRGVTQVVRFGKDGRPAGDDGPAAEGLAAKGLYLAMTHAAFVAEAFGLHDLAIVSLGSDREPFVLVHSRGNYLCVAVEAGMPVEPIVSQLRTILTRQAPR